MPVICLIKKIILGIKSRKNARTVTGLDQQYDYMRIGEYQFINILSSPIRFLMLDFRVKNEDPRLSRSISVTEDNLWSVIQSNVQETDFPILLICGDGALSSRYANTLCSRGYKNIVILEGGTQILSNEFYRIAPTLLYK